MRIFHKFEVRASYEVLWWKSPPADSYKPLAIIVKRHSSTMEVGRKMYKFKSKIQIMGINPFVLVPQQILNLIFEDDNKDKGEWRLYISIKKILPNSLKIIG